MKKILTILAASAMFFAFGEDISNGINFEAYTAYGEGSFNPLGDDPGTESQYWYSASSVGNVISNHVAAPVLPSGVTVPDLFKDDNSNTNFLYLETESPLFRTVKTNGHVPAEFEGVSITTNPIYLDTLVKFTAADSAFTSFEDAADKIAIEYVEHEEESHEDPEGHTNIVDSVGFTNFVIRAGYLSSPIAQTNYYAAVPANFDKDAWHRLTVRSFGSIDAAGNVGFVVYLDGVPLEYDTGVEAGPGFAATGAAAAFYTDSLHALYPSAIPANQTGGQAIAAVAFSGNGSVDDVVFTTDMPKFIKDGESVRTEITLGTGITGVTVTVGENEIDPLDATATPLVFNLPAGTTAFVLGVTADTANGYTFDAATGITASNDVTYAGTTITITGGSPALTLVGKRDNVTYIDGDGQPQSSPSLATAIAGAKSGTTITIAYSINVDDVEGAGFRTYEISGKNIVLDLNGNTITWDDEQGVEEALFSIKSGASFRVIDSSVANTGAIVYTGEYVVFYNKGDCYIGATTGDNGPTIQGKLAAAKAEPQIVRGKFDKASNSKSAAFTWTDYIEEGSELKESLGDYWIVEPQGGSEPTQVAVPTALIGIMYDGTLKTGVVENVGYTLTGNTGTDAGEYEATATLAAGYIWSDNTTADKKIAWGILPNNSAEVVVTLASEIAEYSAQLEFPTATATIGGVAVEGTTNWVENAISEPEAGATNTYTVTFTVTTANYAGSHGTATFKVWKAAAGKTYPSYITDATAQGKYDEWATANNISASDFPDTGNAYQDAYLLNIAPDAADKTLKPTAITISGSTVTITANQNLTSVNGKVYIKTAGTLAGLESASWGEATVDDTTGVIEMTSNGTAAFFKIKVDF